MYIKKLKMIYFRDIFFIRPYNILFYYKISYIIIYIIINLKKNQRINIKLMEIFELIFVWYGIEKNQDLYLDLIWYTYREYHSFSISVESPFICLGIFSRKHLNYIIARYVLPILHAYYNEITFVNGQYIVETILFNFLLKIVFVGLTNCVYNTL